MNPTTSAREVRERLFRSRSPGAPPRVGVEAEFLVMDRATRHPVPPGSSAGPFDPARPTSLPLLGALASVRGWRREEGPGLPRFHLPAETVLSFEPGGQIELATRPWLDLAALDRHLRETVGALVEALEREGIGLLARGLDPWNGPEGAGLYLPLPRYRRMSDHYDRIGSAGRRMMRQSAGIHLNLDLGPDPLHRWERANALVPLLTALFANSSRREGEERGWRSERSAAWRTLDPSRTGIFPPDPDPPAAYTRFAREALAFLASPEGVPASPWCELEAERSEADWRAHLTTLFPEVRPRGYLEIRCVDALPVELVTVAGAVVAGVLLHPTGVSPEAMGLPPWDPELLARAGRVGVRDAAIAEGATRLAPVALEGLERLGPAFAEGALIERVRDFFERCPATGRDPGDAPGDWVEPRGRDLSPPALRAARS